MSPMRIAGRFYRAMRADRLAHVLDVPNADSAGRYHRPGQPALYVTPQADWAVIAIGPYLMEDGAPRVVVPLDVSEAWIVDQRDGAACAALGIMPERSALPWRPALARGEEPSSWVNADRARASGADGLLDCSRGIVDGWHVTLFRWNVTGAPTVSGAGAPLTIAYSEARSR